MGFLYLAQIPNIFCFLTQEGEFNWLLKEEVHAVLKQLQDILKVSVIWYTEGTAWIECDLSPLGVAHLIGCFISFL